MAIIAVIDDEPDMRSLLTRILSRNGYEVVQFAAAESFLLENDREKFACIITDVSMPGMSGFDLLDEVISLVADRNDRKHKHVSRRWLAGNHGEQSPRQEPHEPRSELIASRTVGEFAQSCTGRAGY